MANHDNSAEFIEEGDCREDCRTLYDFMRLTDDMIETIIELDEELIRWRQALIKYLPPRWADGLRQDILDNTAPDFEGNPAYDLYVSWMRGGIDPQHEQARLERIQRLINGTDETSINYL